MSDGEARLSSLYIDTVVMTTGRRDDGATFENVTSVKLFFKY
jgi:hypothetical protein